MIHCPPDLLINQLHAINFEITVILTWIPNTFKFAWLPVQWGLSTGVITFLFNHLHSRCSSFWCILSYRGHLSPQHWSTSEMQGVLRLGPHWCLLLLAPAPNHSPERGWSHWWQWIQSCREQQYENHAGTNGQRGGSRDLRKPLGVQVEEGRWLLWDGVSGKKFVATNIHSLV